METTPKRETEMVARAPKGGVTSQVNGWWYEGGQFTPDHGLFCGKGKNRVTAARFEEVRAAVKADGKELVYDEARGLFQVLLPGGNVMFSAAGLSTLAKAFAV
jgi:hypothetical protein